MNWSNVYCDWSKDWSNTTALSAIWSYNSVPEITVTSTIDNILRDIATLKEAEEERKMKETIKMTVKAKPIITDINVVKPNKVMIVTIQSVDENSGIYIGKPEQVKVVVKEPDVFDMRRGCFIALAKYFYGSTWTLEGVEYQADRMMMQKEYVKIVDKAIKRHNTRQREVEKKERIKAENEAIARRRREKNAKKKAENTKKVKLEAEMWREVSKKLFDQMIQDGNK